MEGRGKKREKLSCGRLLLGHEDTCWSGSLNKFSRARRKGLGAGKVTVLLVAENGGQEDLLAALPGRGVRSDRAGSAFG